ncbi:hypothetical protein [Paraburkholderia sprentiae]|uniref:Uncharacterized protein n=1 Tax=Paraburkholderia sprentiae WSM5005 TaxID=754502 RepID=A0A1I9YQR2_9BURK|nr:hypothetical protein [Paraburkholderia sprentiae]
MVNWNCSQARCTCADGANADGSNGSLAFSRFLSVITVLSRRCVRRRNVLSARAFIAVRTDEVASLLP